MGAQRRPETGCGPEALGRDGGSRSHFTRQPASSGDSCMAEGKEVPDAWKSQPSSQAK